MSVLSTVVTDALNGALGVRVGVGGFGVLVGGTSENDVLVGMGVMVARGVSLGVTARVGLAVQVGSSFMGVDVDVGRGSLNNPPPGGMGLREEAGLIKINAKYPTMQAVRIKTRIESISHIGMEAPEPLDCVPSKSKSSLIYVTPLGLLYENDTCLLALCLNPFPQRQFLQRKIGIG